MQKEKSTKTNLTALKFRMWLQKKKRNAVLGTVRSIVRNMINGVTNGYKFKMVLAYAHFPIVVNVLEGGKVNPFIYLGSLNQELFGFQDEQKN
jgi:large subunit ribosomal protein L9e